MKQVDMDALLHRIEPILYEIITINSYDSIDLLSGRMGDRIEMNAQTLCLTRIQFSDAISHLSRCRKVVNLALWIDPTSGSPNLQRALEPHRLRRLSTGLKCMINSDRVLSFGHPAFSQITHLELMAADQHWDILPGICVLAHLTHFGCILDKIVVEPVGMTQALHTILQNAISLEVLALFVLIRAHEPLAIPLVQGWLRRDQHRDPRLVVLAAPTNEDIYPDWEAFMYGEPDMWTRAEDMIAGRPNGE
jgi:hypothetical protein